MDVFHLLSAGGARFDKRRFAEDMSLFKPGSSSQAGDADADADDGDSSTGRLTALPKELDFFHTGGGGAAHSGGKGKAKAEEDGSVENGRKRKRDSGSGLVSAPPVTPSTLSAFLKKHRIKYSGDDAPLPLSSFSELETRYELRKWLLSNLDGCGWKQPTAIQMGAIPLMLERRDLLAGAPTGSGKTLAFILPILHLLKAPSKEEGFRALIVSPTRELATQIYDQVKRLSEGRKFRVCMLTKAREATMKQDPSLRKKFDILITTPLRLVYGVQQQEIDLSNVRHLVLDEADKLLELGFLEQTDEILAACSHPERRTALFSATLPAGVEELARTFMPYPVRVIVGQKDSATETIKQTLKFVGSEDGKLHAMRELITGGGFKPPVLMFVQSIERAKDLFHELIYDGINVDVIHSERTKAQRDRTVSGFRKGEIWVLICTELMARGMDFKGVNLVINYDFPQTTQSYIHRIGRTGRAGRAGEAITYFTRDDAPYLKSIVNIMRNSGCEVPEWMVQLPSVSQEKRKQLRRKPVERKDVRVAAGSGVGRQMAVRRREMIEASKRRKKKAEGVTGGGEGEGGREVNEKVASGATETGKKKRKKSKASGESGENEA